MRGTETPSAAPPDLRVALEARRERLGGFARVLQYFDRVGSTNDVAARLAAACAPHGTTVVAAAQERGRGRMGRDWFSPPGAGLYVSIVLKPNASSLGPLGLAASVTLTAGVAIAEAVRRETGLGAVIKWPNDLVAGGRKFCGILAEATAGADGVEHVVLGFGLNVGAASYPPALLGRATSIEEELGRGVDAHQLLAEALACLSERLRQLDDDGFEPMLRRWSELSPSAAGARVEVLAPGGDWVAARTAGVDRDGALLVDRAGALHRVIAGEIRWL